MRISIMGCGHMGSAIAEALYKKKLGRVFVSNPSYPKIPAAIHWTVDNKKVVKKTDVICIAVKPNLVQTVLTEIKTALRPRQILISIAAGISLLKLRVWSGRHNKIVRVMPNLPLEVFDGMSVWKASKGITKKDKKVVIKLLNSFGKQMEVRNEKLIDIATAISGGGPAYVAAFLEVMAGVAERAGFSKRESRALAIQTVDGSLDYIKETGIDFSELKRAVQTKGGTTEAGFKILKKKRWQKIYAEALRAGYERTRQLGK